MIGYHMMIDFLIKNYDDEKDKQKFDIESFSFISHNDVQNLFCPECDNDSYWKGINK